MDLWSTLLTIRKRWRVALPVLVLSVLATVFAALNVGVDYEARASVVLTPPPPRVVDGVVLPRLVSKWEPRSLVPVVSRKLSNANQKAALEDQALAHKFTITVDRDAAVIDITATAGSDAGARATAAALVEAAIAATTAVQGLDRVPPEELITAEIVDLDHEAERLAGGRTRVAFALAVLGCGATVLAASAAESLARRAQDETATTTTATTPSRRSTPQRQP